MSNTRKSPQVHIAILQVFCVSHIAFVPIIAGLLGIAYFDLQNKSSWTANNLHWLQEAATQIPNN